MRKFIEETLQPYNFQFDRNSGYGAINGYEVNVGVGYVGPTFLLSTYLPMEKKKEVAARIYALTASKMRASACEQGILFNLASAGTIFTYAKRFNELLPFVLQALEEYQAPKNNICPMTGEELNEENSRLVNLPNSTYKVRMSNGGIATFNNNIEKSNEDFKNAPNNYGKGFLGILIGAVAGTVLTVIFGILGYITFFAPAVSILFGTFLYKKFGGKRNYMMIVMSFVTTLVFIISAFFIVYMITATAICVEAGVNKAGFEAFKTCMELSTDFERMFYVDMGLNALFILGAEGFATYGLIKSIKRPKNV